MKLRNRMNVLVYTSLFPNSLDLNFGVFIKKRMGAFKNLDGCNIIVVAPIPYCPKWRFLKKWTYFAHMPKFEIIDGVEVFHPRYLLLPKISMPFQGFSMFFFSLKLIKRLNKKHQFDIIDGHFIYPDGFASVLVGRMLKLPVCVSARGSDIHTFPENQLIEYLIKAVLKESNHIISVCDTLKDKMIQLGAKKDKISVVPNGVDEELFHKVSMYKCRNLLGISSDKKVILSIGSLTRNKGFHLVIEALSIVIKEIPDVHYYIVGDGDNRIELNAMICNNSLQNNVSMVGIVPNESLKTWYNAADVFCLASAKEGWANVIMESLACETPVVTTDAGAAQEIITSIDHGYLVERTPQSIAKGLLNAFRDNRKFNIVTPPISKRSWNKVAIEIKEIFIRTIYKFKKNL
ncbi:MAG: glycosyltransferase [Desulfobacula sp.]|nr:glycosyltransferase [Desulfobacula sp.]